MNREEKALNGAGVGVLWGLIGDKFDKYKLRPVNPVEAGPYDVGDENFVCDGNGEAYTVYAALANESKSLLKGRYSYSYDGFKAYKLDHVTKQAILLVDLTDYAILSETLNTKDGIIAVDDRYIYLARNAAGYNGRIYKLDHSGNLVSNTETISFELDIEANNNVSAFDLSVSTRRFYQTKNYILARINGSKTYTDTGHYWYWGVINKNTLSVVIPTGTCGDEGDGNGSTMVAYDEDILFTLFCDESYSTSAAYYISNAGVGSRFGDPINPDDFGGHPELYCSFESTNYYLRALTPMVNLGGTQYYKARMGSDFSANSDDDVVYYSVVTMDDFDVTTGRFTLKYITTTNFTFDSSRYDPMLDDWHYNGVDYPVYPSYAAPYDPATIHEDFAATPFFKTDGYYYFIRTLDNKVYKCKDEPVYVVDRVEVTS